jgi:hypothetical protein
VSVFCNCKSLTSAQINESSGVLALFTQLISRNEDINGIRILNVKKQEYNESVERSSGEDIKNGLYRISNFIGNFSTILKAVARLSQFIRNMLITVILFPFV